MTEHLDEETVRSAEHLLRTGAVVGLVLLPCSPAPESNDHYSWADLVEDICVLRQRGLTVQAVVRAPPASDSWGIGLYGHLPRNIGWVPHQAHWLEPPFEVPPEPET